MHVHKREVGMIDQERLSAIISKGAQALGLTRVGQTEAPAGAAAPAPQSQSDTWNHAMQAERPAGIGQFFAVDKRPLTVLAMLVVFSFFWLWLVMALHNNEPPRGSTGEAPPPAPPAPIGAPTASVVTPQAYANSMYNPQSYAQMQTSAIQQYANQYTNDASGAALQAAAANPFGLPEGTAGGGMIMPQQAQMPANTFAYQPTAAMPGGTMPGAAMPGGTMAPVRGHYDLGGPKYYAPLPNGRARLCVSR